MCQRAICVPCGKITYEGCGEHLDQVFAGLSEEEICKCAEGAN